MSRTLKGTGLALLVTVALAAGIYRADQAHFRSFVEGCFQAAGAQAQILSCSHSLAGDGECLVRMDEANRDRLVKGWAGPEGQTTFRLYVTPRDAGTYELHWAAQR